MFALGLTAAYITTAVTLTYPGVLHYSGEALGLPGELFLGLWNILWVHGWLGGHHALYLTHLEFYPTGANVAWDTLSLPQSALAAVLRSVMGLASAYNTTMLASLLADGLAMYAFARKGGLQRLGATLAGLTFMTSPYFVGEMLGHIQLVGAFGVPLFLTVLWDLYHCARSVGKYIWLAVILALTTYVVQDYAVYAVFAGLVLLFLHPDHPWRRVIAQRWRWALAAGAYMAMVAPLLYAMIDGPLAVHGGAPQSLLTRFVVDAEGLVVPDPWGLFAGLGLHWHIAPNLIDGGVFPGFALWAAAIWLWARRRTLSGAHRAIVRWAAVGAVLFAVLSLGPYLHIGGRLYPIPLPDRLLAALPIWQDTVPERLAMMTALFGSILVGVAAELAVAHRNAIAPARRRVTRNATIAGLLLLVAAGSWTAEFPATPLPSVPYAHLVRQAGGTVLYVPAVVPVTNLRYGPFTFVYVQGVLRRPTPEGYISRIPVKLIDRIDASPVLAYLWGTQFTNNPKASLARTAGAQLPAYLRRYDVHSIVFFGGSGVAQPDRTVAWLRDHLSSSWNKRQYGTTTVFVLGS